MKEIQLYIAHKKNVQMCSEKSFFHWKTWLAQLLKLNGIESNIWTRFWLSKKEVWLQKVTLSGISKKRNTQNGLQHRLPPYQLKWFKILLYGKSSQLLTQQDIVVWHSNFFFLIVSLNVHMYFYKFLSHKWIPGPDSKKKRDYKLWNSSIMSVYNYAYNHHNNEVKMR